MTKKRLIEYSIDEKLKNVRVSRFLQDLGYTESAVTRLRHEEGALKINDVTVHMNHRFFTDDERIGIVSNNEKEILEVTISEQESSEKIEAVNLPLAIVYEDEDIIVVNKPPFMPIHPSLNNYKNSLANALSYYYKSKGEPFVFRCINRLDRDTSGLTVVAKHYLAAGILAEDMKERLIKREYTAVVCQTAHIELKERGTIDRPIARVDGSTIERMVSPEGERAVTHYEIIKTKEIFGSGGTTKLHLVKCILDTGRTHQIRVHFKSLGFPLAGDFLYNPDNKLLNRQALHAGRLVMKHPITKEILEFEAELPEDIKKLME